MSLVRKAKFDSWGADGLGCVLELTCQGINFGLFLVAHFLVLEEFVNVFPGLLGGALWVLWEGSSDVKDHQMAHHVRMHRSKNRDHHSTYNTKVDHHNNSCQNIKLISIEGKSRTPY